jgi:hypothetical protein
MISLSYAKRIDDLGTALGEAKKAETSGLVTGMQFGRANMEEPPL